MMKELKVFRWRRRGSIAFRTLVLALVCSSLVPASGARILQQSSALVDDGSQDVVFPSDSSTKAAAPAVAGSAGDTSQSSPAPLKARWASSVSQTDSSEGTDGTAASPRAGLSWANQVRALPPAYQAIGAQIVSQTLGPSSDSGAVSESDTAPADPVTDAAAPAVAVDALPPVAAAVAPVTDPAAAVAGPVPAATFAPTPTPTPQPTFAPTQTPAAEAVPVATALPALVPVEAPATVPAPGDGSSSDMLIVGTALAPVAAPPPRGTSSSLQCSDNGSNNSLALSICKFITGILPAATRQQMCGRFLPKCPPAEPADPPVSATGLTTAGNTVPLAAPAPAPTAAAEPPATATAGGNPSIFGLPIPPLGELLGGLAQGLTGNASPTAAVVPSASPPVASAAAVAG
ncbi:hypothetical protein WJX75_002071 [Coccomyxa subellipsoidea]|uniref:Prolamin-like domain-containing protein n=1 Tax=Coccomyxa subellipsoidea TaxID=248742 RepID=A0ABR2YKH8_9CHLO